jgi:hypothetical protein
MILGTGFVKGFAVILALGVLLSLFTAVVLVHTWLRFVVGNWAEGHKAILVAPKAPPEDGGEAGEKHVESVIKKEIKNTESAIKNEGKVKTVKKKKSKHRKR